jgi:glycosyltransferase involved in cell wall biosynthesis
MRKTPRVIAVLPAYNAGKTVRSVLQSLPKGVFNDIIVSDDCSVDDTITQANREPHIHVIRTKKNLGYGGNLKYCLSTALARGADIVVEIHPDGEYDTDGILPALQAVKKGAVFVLGNRFSSHYPKGMYWWKYVLSRGLTTVCNVVLGTNIPDMHQGFRVYTRKLLETVNYMADSDNYVFSFEIIAQATCRGLAIASVPVTASYKGKKRGASVLPSVVYVFSTCKVLIEYVLARMGVGVVRFAHPNV